EMPAMPGDPDDDAPLYPPQPGYPPAPAGFGIAGYHGPAPAAYGAAPPAPYSPGAPPPAPYSPGAPPPATYNPGAPPPATYSPGAPPAGYGVPPPAAGAPRAEGEQVSEYYRPEFHDAAAAPGEDGDRGLMGFVAGAA